MTSSVRCGRVPINLVRGWPNPNLLPRQLLQTATQRVLANGALADAGLLYGPDEGHPQLRQELASWLTELYQLPKPTAAERLSITGGASQSLGNLLQVFSDPLYTHKIYIVVPAYMLAFRIFDDNGFRGKLKAVPEDDQGLDVGWLEEQMARDDLATSGAHERVKTPRSWNKVYRHIVYAVPTFANPSSRTMSSQRREHLVRLARRTDALVICDDIYDPLRWPAHQPSSLTTAEPPLARLVDVDRDLDGGAERPGADGFGNVVSNGSFSKIAGPGLRCGWVEGTAQLAYGVSQVGTSRSGGAPSQLTSTFLADLLARGELQQHVREVLQPAYARRYRAMMAAIEEHLHPLGVKALQADATAGGYFIWLTLPSTVPAARLAEVCLAAENLAIAPGTLFDVPQEDATANRFGHNARLCFAWEEEHRLGEGVERLARMVGRVADEAAGPGTDMVLDAETASKFW